MKKNLLIEAEKEIQKRVTKKYNTLSGNIQVIKEVLSYHLQGLTLRKISEKIDNKMSANTINEKIIKVYNHKAEFLKFLDRKDIPELLGQTENKIIKIDTPKSITIQDFTPVLDFKEFALHLEKKCQI